MLESHKCIFKNVDLNKISNQLPAGTSVYEENMRDKYLKKWTRKDDLEDVDLIKDKQIKELKIKFRSVQNGLIKLIGIEEFNTVKIFVIYAFIKCSRNNELDY